MRSLLHESRLARARSRATPASLAVSAAAALAFGVLVGGWPHLTLRTLVLLFGIYAVGQGAVRLVVAALHRRAAVGLSLLADALAGVAAGVVVLVWPRISAELLFYVIAAAMVATGLAGVAAVSVLDLDARERTLLGAAAVASVVLGVVVVAWPRHTILALRWVVAAQAFLLGLLLVVVAVRLHRGHRTGAWG